MAAKKPSVWLEMTRDGDTFANAGNRLHLRGRPAWAARELIRLGKRGLRSIDCPATQLPFYIWQLRQAGLKVATIMEEHGGPFAGRHARYVLATPVRIIHVPEKTKPTTGASGPASNPKSLLAGVGGSE